MRNSSSRVSFYLNSKFEVIAESVFPKYGEMDPPLVLFVYGGFYAWAESWGSQHFREFIGLHEEFRNDSTVVIFKPTKICQQEITSASCSNIYPLVEDIEMKTLQCLENCVILSLSF